MSPKGFKDSIFLFDDVFPEVTERQASVAFAAEIALVPNYESKNSKCFIWCRLGNSIAFFLSLSCTDVVPKGLNSRLG